MKEKIVVTGGAGYIGSHTIIELLETTDYEVVSIDNHSHSSAKALERIEKVTGKKVKNYAVDLTDSKATQEVFKENKNIAGVIHFAAFKSVPESVAEPLKYFHNNINSLLNVLQCLQPSGVKKFIFSSSCSIYGNIDQLPVNEQTRPGRAESPYAYTKQVGEQILKDFSKVNPSVSSVSLRYFNPVGAHVSGFIGEEGDESTSLVPVITRFAAGKRKELVVHGNDYSTRDGSCIRDYVHVSDIASAHIHAFKQLNENNNAINYDVFNLGTGNGVSVFEAIQSFEKISGIKLAYTVGPRREGDVEAIYSDTAKASEVLKWKPQYSLDQMMSTAWKWEQQQKD